MNSSFITSRPGQVATNGYFKVFCISPYDQLLYVLVVDGLLRAKGPLFVCDADNLTFVCVETHLPLSSPLLEFIQIILNLKTVGVTPYPPIQ